MKENELVYGIHSVMEALETDRMFDKVLVKTGLKGENALELIDKLRQRGIPVQKVPEERLTRITRKNHQGVIAFLSPIPFYAIDEVVQQVYERGENPFFILLDGITDVRNFGAIARSALAAGVQALVVPARNSARINADAVQTSAGALHKIAVCKVYSLRDTIWYLKNSGIQVFAATESAKDTYYRLDFTAPVAILVGSEENGIAAPNLKAAHHQIKIPVPGNIDSLNVSVATSILAYEVVRQRMLKQENI